MKWIKDDTFAYHYVLEEEDKEYSKTLKKNETNIFAIIYAQQRTKVMANMKVLRVKKPRYKLAMGDLEGYLYFKRLKDAKKFAEKTYEWMLKLDY